MYLWDILAMGSKPARETHYVWFVPYIAWRLGGVLTASYHMRSGLFLLGAFLGAWIFQILEHFRFPRLFFFFLIRNIHYPVHASLNAMKLKFSRESPSFCLHANRHQASCEVIPGNLTVKILVAGHIWLVFPPLLFSYSSTLISRDFNGKPVAS